MNLSPLSPFVRTQGRIRHKGGFTLVEILVAVTILVIIVLLFGQMLAIMSKSWTYGHGRANNFTKARAMLDLLARDIQAGVFRPDLAAFPTSGTTATLEFYTQRPGIPGATTTQLRSISVVQYTFIGPTNPNGGIPNTLERADSPILWTDPASNLLFGSATAFTLTPTARDTAGGVVAFELYFIQTDGTFSATFTPLTTGGVANTPHTRAVSIALAVINDQTIQQLTSAQLTTLNGLLTTTAIPDNPPKHSIKAYWDTYLNTTMNWSNYPKSLSTGLATFERYVTLPNSP